MATSQEISLQPTPERDNFIRFTRLLIAGGTPILRQALNRYHNPTSLVAYLQNARVNFSKPEKNKVFPQSGLQNFEEFDISLIFKLLRNCCGLSEPGTKWNELPQDSDCTLEADIVRISVHRNQIYAHTLEHMALTNDDFEKYWKEISKVLRRMAKKVPGSNTKLKEKIYKLRKEPLTSDDRRIAEKYLRDIKSSLAHQGEKLDNIEAKEDNIKQGIEGLQDSILQSALGRFQLSDQSPTAVSPIQYNNTVMNFTINHSPPNPQAHNSQQKSVTRQLSEDTRLTKPRHQNVYKKSLSLPNEVGKTRRSYDSPEEGYPQFPNAVRTDESRQSPNKQATASRPRHEANTCSFYIDEEDSPDSLSDEEASKTEAFFSLYESADQHFHRGTDHPSSRQELNSAKQTSPNPLFGRTENSENESSSKRPQHHVPSSSDRLDHGPFLRIDISLTPGIMDFHLGHEMRSMMNTSDDEAGISQFYHYLENTRQLIIEKVVDGDVIGDQCCIYVTPRDLTSLEGLYHDYFMGDLREFVKQTVLPEDFMGEVNVHIDDSNYGRCCKSFRPREFKDRGRPSHSQSFSEISRMNTTSEETSQHNIPRSTSVIDLHNVQKNAFEELFLLICKNGGKMDWEKAKSKLSYASCMEVVKPVFRDNMAGYFKFLPRGVIQANVNLKFCPKRTGKSSSCNNSYCPDFHLCPYYVFNDQCNFPNNCKNSHDICDDHANNVFKRVNLLSLSEEERLQLLKHVAYLIPDICFYYNKPSVECRYDSKCFYLHVCKDWALGSECRRNNCRCAHSFEDQHEQNILRKHNLHQMSEKEIIKKLSDHDRAMSNSSCYR